MPHSADTRLSPNSYRWLWVITFAVAMAWMESATVVYLRTHLDRLEPYQSTPLPINAHLGGVEIIREAATILMLVAAGCLAGTNRRTRLAYFLLGFGIWDIFYYIFLAAIGPWPRSVLDWDILFLIPLPWWGPVLAPASIAALMVAGATLVTLTETPERSVWPRVSSWAVGYCGAGLALFVFMSDAIGALQSGGRNALHDLLPASFNWPLFILALAAMAAPVLDVAKQLNAWRGKGKLALSMASEG